MVQAASTQYESSGTCFRTVLHPSYNNQPLPVYEVIDVDTGAVLDMLLVLTCGWCHLRSSCQLSIKFNNENCVEALSTPPLKMRLN